ncbi:nicastrin-like isoform X2 [Dreissena polymorpha]|uniref:nicastrin-like isoform X2 n=1 Tax=Dreissena polymorpha TaxID=45954 RepID=UPI0022653269|nr:nicastrin-like isoform X2 [Dreissena polymorpha]
MRQWKIMAIFTIIITLFAVFLGAYGEPDKLSKKIYHTFSSGYSYCFRRMNGTHQFGCTSAPKGNVGIVHFIRNETDMNWLLNSGPHAPYAALLNKSDFNRATVQKLLDSGKVNGIMVLNNTDQILPDSFSPDDSCPNQGHGLYAKDPAYQSCSKVQWNQNADGLMMMDLSIPIFIINDASDTKMLIETCYEGHNQPHADGSARDYPLCAVELKDRMDGAKDSETCIRRTRHQLNLEPQGYCDPLGDYNVYGTVKALNNTESRPDKSVIIAAARLDSFSLFDGLSPGADSAIAGIITLLAAAEAIGKVKETIQAAQLSHDIMFTFFNGEAFDYIGSDRLVYDMTNMDFPKPSTKPYLSQIHLNHISHFVEVSQVAHRDAGKLWLHTDPLTKDKPEVKAQLEHLVSLFLEANSSLVARVNNSNPLPPASVQSFLKAILNQTNLIFPAVVLADHETVYTNKYYNSWLDLRSGINLNYTGDSTTWYDEDTQVATDLTEAADMVAKVLFKLAMNGTLNETTVSANKTTVKHLLYCFLVQANCTILKDIFDEDFAKNLPYSTYPTYVSVATSFNDFTNVVQQLLISFLGEVRYNATKETCRDNDQTVYKYVWMQGHEDHNGTRNESFCMRAAVNVSDAASKAFDIHDYDYKSGQYSTWTESRWAGNAMSIRLFLKPSKAFEVSTLVAGIVILIVSLVGGFFLHKRASILFPDSPTSSPSPVSL